MSCHEEFILTPGTLRPDGYIGIRENIDYGSLDARTMSRLSSVDFERPARGK